MNRNRLIVIAVIAIAIAGLLTLAALRMLNRTLAAGKRPMVKVAVATADLAVGTRIKTEDVRLADMPATDLPEGTSQTAEGIVGRGVIVPIRRSELITDSKLASEKAGSGLPSLIPANMRAVSVKVNDVIAVAGFVVPGTRVDVLLTGYPNGRQNEADVMTTTVLENVEVLAAGKDMQQNPEGGKPQTVTVITLLVSPEAAQRLTLASSEGKIQLALRNPLDLTKETLPAVRNATLYHVEAPQARVVKTVAKNKPVIPPPTTAYVVELIRGDKRESTTF